MPKRARPDEFSPESAAVVARAIRDKSLSIIDHMEKDRMPPDAAGAMWKLVALALKTDDTDTAAALYLAARVAERAAANGEFIDQLWAEMQRCERDPTFAPWLPDLHARWPNQFPLTGRTTRSTR